MAPFDLYSYIESQKKKNRKWCSIYYLKPNLYKSKKKVKIFLSNSAPQKKMITHISTKRLFKRKSFIPMAPCYTKQQRKKKIFLHFKQNNNTIYLTEKENYF